MESTARELAASLTEQEVLDYLESHIDFFMGHEKTLEKMSIPSMQGQNVTSFGDFQVKKLKNKLTRTEERNQLLIQTSTQNHHIEKQLNDLTLDLLSAKNIESLKTCLETDLKKKFGIDSITFYSLDEMPLEEINRLLPNGKMVKLRTLFKTTEKEIHQENTAEIASDAVIRISHNDETKALLVLGSIDAQHYHEGQGDDLLRFFGSIIGHCMARL